MNIKCPKCDTTYDVSHEIANSGAQVQCAKCSDIFTASPAPETLREPQGEPDQPSDPAPEQDLEQDIVFEAIDEGQPESEAEGQPAPQSEDQSLEQTELLNADEKDFFSSFGTRLAEEEAAGTAIEGGDPAAAEQKADEPPAENTQDDDIGWEESEEETPPAKAADEGQFDAVQSLADEGQFDTVQNLADEDLFADADLQAAGEPEAELKAEPQASTPEDIDEEIIDKATAWKNIPPTLLGWGALAASLVLLVVGTAVLRVPIVKAVPGMAGLYEAVGAPVNIRGLEFYGLSHQWENEGGRMRLVVRGEIVNITSDAVPVPEIVFAMLDGSGLEFFQWTERATTGQLAANARTRFRAQIPAPADRVRQLKIRFAKR